MYSYSGWPLPKGILPKEERWLKFSPHSAIQATYLGCLSPRGMFSTLHKGILWADGSIEPLAYSELVWHAS